jgi:Uma2 family endonuclease
MPKTMQRPATYEDLLKVPPHLVAEIVEGELFTSPRPRSRHAVAAGRVFRRLGSKFEDGDDGPGGWWLLFEPELHLGHDVLVPDIAGWRRERMPSIPDVAGFALAPDWVCEVTSPSTGKLDRFYKAPVYARHRIPYGWILDPIARGLELHRLENSHWALIETYVGDQVARSEPFESVELNLSDFWLA